MDRIPALSIRQPWAQLILIGEKTLEVRSWSTDYRGLLWVHTGFKGDDRTESQFGFLDLFKGGFVGSVVLNAVIPLDRHRWSEWRSKHLCSGPYQPGLYGWILSSPHPFAHPISAPGRLNLFYPAPDLGKALEQENSRAGTIGAAVST